MVTGVVHYATRLLTVDILSSSLCVVVNAHFSSSTWVPSSGGQSHRQHQQQLQPQQDLCSSYQQVLPLPPSLVPKVMTL